MKIFDMLLANAMMGEGGGGGGGGGDFPVANVTIVSTNNDAYIGSYLTVWDEAHNHNIETGICEIADGVWSNEIGFMGEVNTTVKYVLLSESVEFTGGDTINSMVGTGAVTVVHNPDSESAPYVAIITGDCTITIS